MATTQRRPKKEQHDGGMMPLSERSVAFHRTPLPGAREEPGPFPQFVTLSLGVSVVVGALLGLLFAALLLRGVVVLPGWGAMFADGALTLYTLWAGIGAALGIAASSVVLAFWTPGSRRG